jgi:hypothetical protein
VVVRSFHEYTARGALHDCGQSVIVLKARIGSDGRPPIAQRQGNLGQRAQTATESDNAIGRPGQ